MKLVFEKSSIIEELFIVNVFKKYLKISFCIDKKLFYVEKKEFNTFDEMLDYLILNEFVFDNKLRVFYTLDDNVPSSFQGLIDEVK